MNDILELKNKLLSLGASNNDLDTIIKEVNEVVLAKVMATYLRQLSNEQIDKLKLISENGIIEYLNNHRDEFPAFSNEKFQQVYLETWENYFKAIKQSIK